EISRAEKLVRERFVHEGEDPAIALAPGSARRRALDQALAELQADPKAKRPSTAWRREFSLLLGLERLLSEPEPALADGTVLSGHQVGALSGTLTALLAAAQSAAADGNGRSGTSASPELLASADILGPEDVVAQNDSQAAARRAGARPAAAPSTEAALADEDEDEDEDELQEQDDEDDDLGPIQRAAPDDEEDEDDLSGEDELARELAEE